ncbi:MAG: hypothetical protein H6672_01535 [Anaerolineaceae bacterium]|nr:hypothetical protein [Anaerolineaceae bacterium]
MNQYFPSDNPNFDDMLQAGRVALQAGKPELAHDIWREAAKMQPYDERVWLALLDVLTADSDKLVCLRNIVSINPMNVQAQRQLNALEARTERVAEQEIEDAHQETMWRIRRRQLLSRSILLGLAIGLSGLLFALLVLVIQQLT